MRWFPSAQTQTQTGFSDSLSFLATSKISILLNPIYLKSLSINGDLAVSHIGVEGALSDAPKSDGLLTAGLCAGVDTAPPGAGAARALAAVSTVTLHKVKTLVKFPCTRFVVENRG